MRYVYVLFSQKDHGLYIGFTKDLKRRFHEHTQSLSISTKGRKPFILIYYESFINDSDARAREKYLKSGYGREQLAIILKRTFKDLNI